MRLLHLSLKMQREVELPLLLLLTRLRNKILSNGSQIYAKSKCSNIEVQRYGKLSSYLICDIFRPSAWRSICCLLERKPINKVSSALFVAQAKVPIFGKLLRFR